MEPVESDGRSARRRAAIACLVLFFFWALTLDRSHTWGWDESMHAELPALRLLLALAEGEGGLFSSALFDCQSYPFGWPLVLAALQAIFGVSEFVCRVAGLGAWCLTLFGLFLLGQELAQGRREDEGPRRDDRAAFAPWVAGGPRPR